MLSRWTGAVVVLALLVPSRVFAQIDPLPTVFWFRGSPTVVVVHNEVPEGGAVVEKLGRLPEESLFAEFTFDPSRTAVDARPVNNLDGLGKRAIALLAADDAQARPVVEVRSLRGARLRNVPFNKGHEAIALDILPDQNGNQSEEALVLARQTAFDRPRLLIRDLATKEKVNNISLPKTFEALDVTVARDLTGNGFSEALVLAARKSDGRNFVLVWDTGDMGQIVHIKLRPGFTAIDHDYWRTSFGHDLLLVLVRKLDGSITARCLDPLTGEEITRDTCKAFWLSGTDPVAYSREFVLTAFSGRPVKAWQWTILGWDEALNRATAWQGVEFSEGLRPLEIALVDHFASTLRHEAATLLRDPADGALYLSVRSTKSNELLFKRSIP